MKKLFLLLFCISMVSCSSDDNETNEPSNSYPMTFKMNGELYEVYSPLGDNMASGTTIWNTYPEDEYILIQGRNGIFGGIEIGIWIRREHLISGTTYEVSRDTEDQTTHIDLINNTNEIGEYTNSGSITIESVDEINKRVIGTFHFTTTDYQSEDVDYTITDGTFDYFYE